MKRIFALLMVLVLVFACAGCAEEKEPTGYAASEEATAALEEAIALMDYCLADKVTPDALANQLVIVVDEYAESKDHMARIAAVNIGTASTQINVICFEMDMNKATLVDVMDTVQEQRDILYDLLHG